jgi:hypothetical protein
MDIEGEEVLMLREVVAVWEALVICWSYLGVNI